MMAMLRRSARDCIRRSSQIGGQRTLAGPPSVPLPGRLGGGRDHGGGSMHDDWTGEGRPDVPHDRYVEGYPPPPPAGRTPPPYQEYAAPGYGFRAEQAEEPTWEEAGRTRRWWVLGGVATAVLAVLAVGAVLVFQAGKGKDPLPTAAAATSSGPSPSAVTSPAEPLAAPEPSTAPPSPSSTAPSSTRSSASRTPSRPASVKPSIEPSKRPVQEQVAPAPAPTATATTNCPTYEGTAAAKADVRAELEGASTYVFWKTSAPSIRVPLDLLKAIAW